MKQSVQSASNPPSLASSGNKNKKKTNGFLFKEQNKNLATSNNKSEEIHSELIKEDHSSKIFRSEGFLANNKKKNSKKSKAFLKFIQYFNRKIIFIMFNKLFSL